MKPSLFQLIFEWNALFFWSNIFPFWDSVFLGTLIFFSAVWAFHVYSSLSGCGMPYFFLVRHFSILGLSIFFNINFFFSCLGISCLLIFEWIRNTLLFCGSSFYHSNTCWLYTDCYFFKLSESGSLKGQDQPVRKRKRSEVLIEEASLINLSNDNEDSKKDKKGKKCYISQ